MTANTETEEGTQVYLWILSPSEEARTQNSFQQSYFRISQAHRVVPAAKSSQTEKREADLELDKYGLLNGI